MQCVIVVQEAEINGLCCRVAALQEWHKVPGTTFTVDRFGKGTEKLPGRSRFLTHFHSDHYKGLTSRFKAGAVSASAPAALFACRTHAQNPKGVF